MHIHTSAVKTAIILYQCWCSLKVARSLGQSDNEMHNLDETSEQMAHWICRGSSSPLKKKIKLKHNTPPLQSLAFLFLIQPLKTDKRGSTPCWNSSQTFWEAWPDSGGSHYNMVYSRNTRMKKKTKKTKKTWHKFVNLQEVWQYHLYCPSSSFPCHSSEIE